MCENEKRQFLRNEWFNMAWQASVQHSKTYIDIPKDSKKPELKQRKKLLEESKKKLKDDIRQGLDGWILGGQSRSRDDYIDYVVNLSNNITGNQEYQQWLAENQQRVKRFRIGTSQKLCGLYLKYLWCGEEIKWRPPACPFDRQILHELGFDIDKVKWTDMDDKDGQILREWIRKAEKVANDIAHSEYRNSIAVWELLTFERLRNKSK